MEASHLRPFLPRLVAAYDRGLLVPFVGSGMSRDACRSWAGFVERLSQEARSDEAASTRRGNLTWQADRAVQKLRRQAPTRRGELSAAIRTALYASPAGGLEDPPIPAQTLALATIWWPLVLTTNYDNLFTRAHAMNWDQPGTQLLVLGRTEADVQRVLSSLSVPDRPVLWALQGTLDADGTTPERDLSGELVVGHQEYRRATHGSPHFRRAFAEVFRGRSLLFLGSSLSEPYFLELFGEIVEFFGPSPLPHYAFALADEHDRAFLRSRYNIHVLEYASHADLPRWLAHLGEAIVGTRPRVTAWHCHWRQPAGLRLHAQLGESGAIGPPTPAALTLTHAPLPEAPPAPPREAVAVNVGVNTDRSAYLGTNLGALARRLAATLAYEDPSRWTRTPGDEGPYLYLPAERDTPRQLLLVSAWRTSDKRDLRAIATAVEHTVSWACTEGIRHVRMPLLASGRAKHYHSRFALVQMIRGYGRWLREAGARGHRRPVPVRLTIHLQDADAIFELTSGRVDLLELLTAHDIRFWAEIHEGARMVSRELLFRREETALATIAAELGLPRENWNVEVDPSPGPDASIRPIGDRARDTLVDLGVVPGSTLRFTPVRGKGRTA